MADLDPIPNRDAVIDPKTGIVTRPWLRWLVLLRDAVNKLIGGTFDGDVTVAGALSVTGALSAASAAITGAVTAATLTLTGLLTGVTATFSGALTALTLTLTNGQIVFPAVQVASAGANVLDDYEESVTPIVPTSPNITYAAGSGFHYQKTGSWVHVTGLIVFPATADANQAEINNLPYACENSAPVRGGCVSHFGNFGVSVGFLVVNNATRVQLFNPTTAAVITNAALSGLNGFFDFKYRAAA